jgi:CDP-paratose 2-epimerase
MSVILVTGSAGLIGSETTKWFAAQGHDVVGVDNNMRRKFFGTDASTEWMRDHLQREFAGYRHEAIDIRDREAIFDLFERYGREICLVIHTAAQPSHDWAAREPFTDFEINALGTLTMLEATRQYCPDAVFIFTSTNKVYGDTPNSLPLIEQELRWEIEPGHPFRNGISESMSIDSTMHSVFGASKTAADVMVQEYGRYFGMKTACFRGGCLTGPSHSGAELHGFLSYLMKCCAIGTPYRVFGYKGKQVRDNIHSLDVARFMAAFVGAPRAGEVYNLGGGKANSCSILEAFQLAEKFSGKKQIYTYLDQARAGDHICYYSDLRKMRTHYPAWDITQSLEETIRQIVESWKTRNIS